MSKAMGETVRATPDGPRVVTVEQFEKLRARIVELQEKLHESVATAEMYMLALGNDEAMAVEIRTLREFIADVRRGIRDLSEYEDVCGP